MLISIDTCLPMSVIRHISDKLGKQHECFPDMLVTYWYRYLSDMLVSIGACLPKVVSIPTNGNKPET
jgi:hypothetical protein